MALELQKHQQDAYDNVKKYFEEGDRSIVIFPTGCGKSFVSLKLMEDNRDSRILFVCPVTPIENQMYEYIIKYLSTEETDEKIRIEEERKKRPLGIGEKAKIILPNFKVVLYPTMISKSKKTQELLDKLKPDFIICDEVHHISTRIQQDETQENEEDRAKDIKAQENLWGRAMVDFTAKNPQAKILGITATPERGDGVDVAIRFFGGKIASEISLIEALTSGKIPAKAPDYVPCVYTLINEIDEGSIQEQIKQYKVSNPKKAEELEQKLEEMRKVADSGKGISDLFTEHLTTQEAKKLGRDKGKYIVFCDDIEDMKQKMEEAKIWFAGVDSEPEIYAVSSNYNQSPNTFEGSKEYSQQVIANFEKSQSNHIKLLFSVNMLNEGLHVDDVSGVIMTRKTNSRNVYLQQLGRAISSDATKPKPIVFDIANNYLTYNIYGELVEAIKKQEQKEFGTKGRENTKSGEEGTYEHSDDEWIETFRINGIMRDLLELLKEQNYSMSAGEIFMRKLEILRRNGVETSKLEHRDTIKILAERTDNIDLEKLGEELEKEGFSLDDRIGNMLMHLRSAFRGKGHVKPLTKEQVRILFEKYGITLERYDAGQAFLRKLEILKRNGVITSRIASGNTIRTLARKTENIDLEKLREELEKEGFSLDDRIGSALDDFRKSARGKGSRKPLTEEQEKNLLEEYGISLKSQKKDSAQEFFSKLEILKRNGISTSEIQAKDTIRTLAEGTENIDLEKLGEELEKEGFSLDDRIGYMLYHFKDAAKGRGRTKKLDAGQERILLEEYGISVETSDYGQLFLLRLEILKRNGVITSKITAMDTLETLAKKTENIDLKRLEEELESEGFKLDEKIGQFLSGFRLASKGKGTRKPLNEEQAKILYEQYGISLEKKKIKPKDIAQDTYTATAPECEEASNVINGLVIEKEKQQSSVNLIDPK